jgi:hypothetical protein
MGGGHPERWNPSPPSPRATEVVEEQVPVAGAEAPAAGRSVEEAAHTAKVPASAAEASGSAVMDTTSEPQHLLNPQGRGSETSPP